MGLLDTDMRPGNGPRDRAIARLATRQHGVVAFVQLIELGLDPRAIQYRAEIGRLHRIHTGVYAVGHRSISLRGRWMAAVLASGARALLSHRAAGALLELRPSSPRDIDVTAPGRSRNGVERITVHRVRSLHPDDGVVRHGIPVTSVAPTLLDLAEVLRLRQLERVVEQAERLRLLDLRAIEALLARSHGRHGASPLREVLGAAHEPPDVRSEWERDFPGFCVAAGLPRPEMNAYVEGYLVDALWRERLVAELDGYAYHRSRRAFENDRLRDATLQLAGYRVLRITWRRLEREPEAVAATIRALLG